MKQTGLLLMALSALTFALFLVINRSTSILVGVGNNYIPNISNWIVFTVFVYGLIIFIREILKEKDDD